MNADTVINIGLIAGWTVLFAVASVFPTPVNAETVREQMLIASQGSRNTAFTTFLAQHGKVCAVNESKFTTNVRRSGANGDVWSVRCVDGSAFAVFISDDSKSTSWFMPCAVLHRRTNLRCFEAPPKQIAFK